VTKVLTEATCVTSCCSGFYELPLTRLLLGSSYHPGGLELTDKLARAVALGPRDKVCDIASGRGDTALHLLKKYGSQVVGLDYSEDQVQKANARAQEQNMDHRVSFVQGDAGYLPFSDGAFNIAFCECALCTFPQRIQAVKEVHRILDNRGILALSDVVLNRPLPDELQGIVGQVLCISGALSVEGYHDVLREGGFDNIHYRDESDSLVLLIAQIESRLSKVAEMDSSEFVEGLDLLEMKETLGAAREFVLAKGLGYATFVAKK